MNEMYAMPHTCITFVHNFGQFMVICWPSQECEKELSVVMIKPRRYICPWRLTLLLAAGVPV